MLLHYNKFMVNSSLDRLSKKQNIIKWIFFSLAVALSLFLIINGAIQGESSAKESNGLARVLANLINSIKPGAITEESFPQFASFMRKLCGHFLAFTVDAVFATIAIYYFVITRKWYKFYYILLITLGFGLLVAGVSELLQLFTPGRVGTFKDIGIDMGGYLLGVAIIFLVLLCCKKLNPKSTKSLDKNVAD